MKPVFYVVCALIIASALAAPQQPREDEDKSAEAPTEQKKPAEPADNQGNNNDGDDVRREEHKKIVPFQFHRVCRDLDLKRQNCSCVWEATFQDGLEKASETAKECKSDTEEETFECLKKLEGYEDCVSNPSFEHLRPSLSDETVSRKCQEFSLSDAQCTCLKEKDKNDALKSALIACKDEAKKSQQSEEPEVKEESKVEPAKAVANKKSKRQTKPDEEKEDSPAQEVSEHSQTKATPIVSSFQHQINKECVIKALTNNCKTDRK